MATVKKFAMAAGAALFSLGITGVERVDAITITFDDLGLSATDIISGDEYIDQGIVFSTPDRELVLGGTCATCSQPLSLGADRTFLGDFSGSVVGQFTNNRFVTDLQLTLLNPAYSVSAYDVAGNLLVTFEGSPIIGTTSDRFDFSGYSVNRFETSGSLYALDDVTYGELKAVPEPSSIIGTMALGAVGASLMLKRKLRKEIS